MWELHDAEGGHLDFWVCISLPCGGFFPFIPSTIQNHLPGNPAEAYNAGFCKLTLSNHLINASTDDTFANTVHAPTGKLLPILCLRQWVFKLVPIKKPPCVEGYEKLVGSLITIYHLLHQNKKVIITHNLAIF